MRAFSRLSGWVVAMSLLSSLFASTVAWAQRAGVKPGKPQTTAFYYGQSLPRELATTYDQVVVQPDHVGDPAAIRALGAEPVAYFSVGEAAPSQISGLQPAWILAKNAAWASLVMDLANPDYRAYLVARFEVLYARGFHRLFLDTLDSYQLAAKTDAARAKQRAGIVALLKAFKAKHGDVQMIVNRGFELLPEIAPLVSGVVAESLFDRWDAGRKQYTRVPENDREWLLAKLREAQSLHLPVTVIDYRPTNERDAARETAKRIQKLGFEPWVCNGDLSDIGIGHYEILPRKVLLLTDSPMKNGAAVGGGPLSWLSPILEYLGYVPELRSVHAGLPEEAVAGRYAGVITWFEGASVPTGYGKWMLEQTQQGTRFAVFGALGFDATSNAGRELGFAPARPALDTAKAGSSIVARDSLIGFEAEPPLHPVPGTGLVLLGSGVTHHLRALDQAGNLCDPIATAAWGGIATSHVFGLRGLHGERAWVLDPFAFLTRALQLPVMPVPDVTTENGSRLAVFVIETQGAADRARLRGSPAVWTVLRDEVLGPYGWPHAMHSATADDREGAKSLLQLSAAYADGLPGGETDARGNFGSLTHVQAMASQEANGVRIPAPIAWDATYVPGGAESYPYERVIETFEFTDLPRRLKPIALHYHAYTAASPAGVDTLKKIYAYLAQRDVLPIRVSEYTARVNAFREQIIARDLDGAFIVTGGRELRTLRVPTELGLPDLAASSGVAAVRTLAQGRYVSFAGEGPRKLVLGAKNLERPHVVRANGQLQSFEVDNGRIKFELSAAEGLKLDLAGLPASARCELRLAHRQLRMTTSAGRSLELRLPERATGASELRCGASE